MSPRKKPPPTETPPATERARDPERTRARLLDAAEEEFGARGFHGARVRAIVDAAGCNERMLYHYFGDKEGLYRALVERALQVTSDAVATALAGADASDVPALLERVLHAFAEALEARPSFARLVVHEALEGFKSFPKLTAEPGDPLLSQLQPLWDGAVKRGDLRKGADLRVALAMGALVALVWPIGIPRLQRLFPERDLATTESLDWARGRVVDILLRGVLGNRSRQS